MDQERIEKEIRHWYNLGKGSIQDYARIYKISVEEVLEIVGESNLGTVEVTGDMIDASEAGPGAEMNYGGPVKVPFDVS